MDNWWTSTIMWSILKVYRTVFFWIMQWFRTTFTNLLYNETQILTWIYLYALVTLQRQRHSGFCILRPQISRFCPVYRTCGIVCLSVVWHHLKISYIEIVIIYVHTWLCPISAFLSLHLTNVKLEFNKVFVRNHSIQLANLPKGLSI